LCFSLFLAVKKNSLEIEINKEEKIEKRNEVYISINDTINYFSTNLSVDEMQDKPDMLYLRKRVDKTSIIIPTDSPIEIRGGNPTISFYYELKLEKEDSLLINVEKTNITNISKQNIRSSQF
jgi:hypothetical protein